MTPQPTQPHTFTEAPASVTLKISYKGYSGILFTLRDATGAGLLDKLDAALSKFEKLGITPDARPAAPTQTAGGDPPMCPEHGEMKQGKRGWYCPKVVTEVQGKKIYCKHTA